MENCPFRKVVIRTKEFETDRFVSNEEYLKLLSESCEKALASKFPPKEEKKDTAIYAFIHKTPEPYTLILMDDFEYVSGDYSGELQYKRLHDGDIHAPEILTVQKKALVE